MALYLIIRIGSFLSRIIPRPWRYLIGTAVGDMVFLSWRQKRRILVHNMATILGRSPTDREVRRVALQSMRNYCKYLVEFLELPGRSQADNLMHEMRVHGTEHLVEAIDRGKGVIVATAHFGTIEVGARELARHSCFHAVHDTFRPAYLDQLIQNKRRQMGINPIPVQNIRQMMRVLHEGGALALLFDRPVRLAQGVPVQFFGHQTALPGGPAVLAMKTGATLLPTYQFRLPDRTFEGVIMPPITWTPTGDRDHDIQVIMQKLVDTFQSVVRARPDQWYMFRPMWPDVFPGDERSLRALPRTR